MNRLPGRTAQQKSAKDASLGLVLDEVGFKPLGRRVKIKRGIDQPKLRRPLSIKACNEPEGDSGR